MIEIRGLDVTFNPGGALETHALKGVALTISQGEFVTLIGGNGAGKSTLLNAIAGEAPVSAGQILIEGVDVAHRTTAQRAAQIARVFQNPAAGVCEGLSIEENMALAAARGTRRGLRAALNTQTRKLFRDRLAPLGLGLENRLRDPAGALSGGQRQAMCLVMAMLRSAKLLLLDEHTAALDPRAAAFVIERTKSIVAEAGVTTLMVTHSMAQALDCGGRTIMMDQGRIALDISGDERRDATPASLTARFGAAGDNLALHA